MDGRELCILKEALLANLERKETLDPEKLATLTAVFEHASHDGPCPCGAGRKFSECCKIDWIILRERVEKVPESPAPTPVDKGNGKDHHAAPDGQWVCRIGFNSDGSIRVEPEGVGQKMNPLDMAGLLLTAYHLVNSNGIINITRRFITQRQSFDNPPTPIRR